MIEVDLRISSSVQSEELIKKVEQICDQHDLACTLKGTLASYPGCVHWHFKKGRETGTLEITWWEKEGRLWLKMSEHSKAMWIEEMIPHLKKQIETSLA